MTNHSLEIFLAQLAVMLGIGLFGGAVARSLHQPAVLGELIGGILLGPSVFGTLLPHVYASLFPSNPEVIATRGAVTNLGLLFFCFSRDCR